VSEFREWIQLFFIVVGGSIGLVAYFQNLRQRRVENALKFISLFRDGLRAGDMDEWEKLFHAASEPTGSPPGHYKVVDGPYVTIGAYFSEGSPDGYAISRMAESLDVVCHQVVTGVADAQTVYYELGQLLWSMNNWLKPIPAISGKGSFLEQSFPSIAKFHSKFGKKMRKWPSRIIAYID
jgi:hypothetical protein